MPARCAQCSEGKQLVVSVSGLKLFLIAMGRSEREVLRAFSGSAAATSKNSFFPAIYAGKKRDYDR